MNLSHFDRNSVGRIIQDLDFLEYFNLACFDSVFPALSLLRS